MANICSGQQQIHITLTGIVRVITKVPREAMLCLGTSIFFLCWQITINIGLSDFLPFHEHLLKHKNHFSVLT